MCWCWSGRRPPLAARRPDQTASQPADTQAPSGTRHVSPLRVSAPVHAPRTGWATAVGRSPGSRLDRCRRLPGLSASGWVPASSPFTVAGAATDWLRRLDRRVANRVPFSPRTGTGARNQQSFLSSHAPRGESRRRRACRRIGRQESCCVPGTPQRGHRLPATLSCAVGGGREPVSLGPRYKKTDSSVCASRSSTRFRSRAAR